MPDPQRPEPEDDALESLREEAEATTGTDTEHVIYEEGFTGRTIVGALFVAGPLGLAWVQRREREEVQAALRGRVRAARQELAAAVQDLRRLAPADSPPIAPSPVPGIRRSSGLARLRPRAHRAGR